MTEQMTPEKMAEQLVQRFDKTAVDGGFTDDQKAAIEDRLKSMMESLNKHYPATDKRQKIFSLLAAAGIGSAAGAAGGSLLGHVSGDDDEEINRKSNRGLILGGATATMGLAGLNRMTPNQRRRLLSAAKRTAAGAAIGGGAMSTYSALSGGSPGDVRKDLVRGVLYGGAGTAAGTAAADYLQDKTLGERLFTDNPKLKPVKSASTQKVAIRERLMDALGSASESVSKLTDRLSPQQHQRLLKTLAGAGIGAGAGALLGGASGGSVYDLARGATAGGLVGGAGTALTLAGKDFINSDRYVPPSVQKTLDAMKQKGISTEPKESKPGLLRRAATWPFRTFDAPLTTAAGAGIGLAGAHEAAAALDPRPGLLSRFRSPLATYGPLGGMDDMAPNAVARPSNIVAGHKGETWVQALRREAKNIKPRTVEYFSGPESIRSASFNNIRSNLLNNAAAMDAAGNVEGAKKLRELVEMPDEQLRQVTEAAKRNLLKSSPIQAGSSPRPNAAKSQRAAAAAANDFNWAMSGKKPKIVPGKPVPKSPTTSAISPNRFSEMASRPSRFSTGKAIGAGALTLSAVLADRFVLPRMTGKSDLPDLSLEDVRRMGN